MERLISEPGYVTISQWAQKHGISRQYCWTAIQRGRLPALYLGTTWLIKEDEPYPKLLKRGRVKGRKYPRKAAPSPVRGLKRDEAMGGISKGEGEGDEMLFPLDF